MHFCVSYKQLHFRISLSEYFSMSNNNMTLVQIPAIQEFHDKLEGASLVRNSASLLLPDFHISLSIIVLYCTGFKQDTLARGFKNLLGI